MELGAFCVKALKRALLVIVLVLAADQTLKIWVKTHFFIGEYVPLFGAESTKGYLQFVENKGMAFGLEFGGETGKLLLTLFRIVAVIAIGFILRNIIHQQRDKWMITSLALIFAGALGNIIDSAFYGLIFNGSDPVARNVASLFSPEGGYAPFLHGAVVDMFYFPLWQGRFPEWLPIWGGESFEFFRPVFNVADAAISVGVAMMVLVQRKPKEDSSLGSTTPTVTEGAILEPES
ncbi:MAG: lipoprotein signal peptidase [Flavobacteriales bacterium]|nr:lipoprotein signal peptidase [Flavobacteriales bacterium]MBL0044187.1 lipoprotein signal peptidase [Flavobacteriales bacterium]